MNPTPSPLEAAPEVRAESDCSNLSRGGVKRGGTQRLDGVTNTIEQAREVRSLAATGAKTAEIAQQTGVHPTMVAEMRQGRSWRELAASPFAGLGA